MKRFIIVLLLLSVAVLSPAAAQEDPPAIDPELEAEMIDLEAITEEIRNLDGEPVVREFPSREETIEYLRNSIDEELPQDEAERYEDFYVAFGLIDPDVNLREVYLTLLGAQVAGFYDPESKTMNVIPTGGGVTDDLSVTEEIIYVHEFVHALQDQFFGLAELTDNDEIYDNPDRALATTSLFEGDATAVMQVYTERIMQQNPLAAFQLLGESLAAGNLTLPAGTPEILGEELLFPYNGGMVFVLALYNETESWELVDAAYENLPTTTEQILHPEKYIAGEQAVEVTLADTEETLGGSWQQTWDTTLGEWYLQQHLQTQLTNDQANAAAAGWGGDRFHIYRDIEGNLAWVIRLAWDSEEESTEFAESYAEFNNAYFASEAADSCWESENGVRCLVTLDGGDTLIAQAPTLELARALVDAQ